MGGGQLNVTLLFSLVINRNRWQCSVDVLQVRDGLIRNYRLTFPVMIVSLIITRTDCALPLNVRLSVFTLCKVWFQNPLESPAVPSVCFFQSFYKLNANIHRGT